MSKAAGADTRYRAGPSLPGFDMAGLSMTANEKRVVEIIHRQADATRADVTRETDLAAQSISRIVDGLVDRGLVSLGEKMITGRGQPSPHLLLNHDAAYSVGLSIMTDAVSGVVMNLGGEVIAKHWIHLTDVHRDAIFHSAKTVFDQLVAATGIDHHRIAGVGVAVTGFFVGRGRQVNPPDPLGEIAFIEIDRELVASVQRPVWLENDGKAAAMGEALTGIGRRFPTFAYIFFSMGLGGAVVIDGRVFPGVFGNAGEFAGIWRLDEQDDRPTLEQLRRMMAQGGVAHPDIYAMISDFDVDAPGVEEWIDRALPRLDQLASAISAVLDPEAVVLGGRIPKALAQRLADRMAVYGIPRRNVIKPNPQIVVSTVSGDAAAIGAAATPLKARFFG